MQAVTLTSEPNDTLTQAVSRGLRFLSFRQLPTGQFPVEATTHEPQTTVLDQSLFATTHIVHSLDFVEGTEARTMIDAGLRYFLAEMSPGGLWRYWNKAASWGGRPIHSFIPADLDDTASVSYLLQRHGVPFPDNRSLLLLNRNRAGLFYTWLMMRPVGTLNVRYWLSMLRELTAARLTVFWKKTEAGYLDVDGVVIANALLYLGERPETEASVAWLIDIIETGHEASCDKWYRAPFSLYYALSRSYGNGVRSLGIAAPTIVARLREAALASGQIGDNPLQTALAANTLIYLGAGGEACLDRAAQYLLLTQAADGSWPSAPYYYGGPKKAVSWGSAELTTGLCLEALAQYKNRGR